MVGNMFCAVPECGERASGLCDWHYTSLNGSHMRALSRAKARGNAQYQIELMKAVVFLFENGLGTSAESRDKGVLSDEY